MSLEINRRSALMGFGGMTLLGALAACAPAGFTPKPTNAAATDFAFASWGMSETATKPVLGPVINSFAAQEGVSISTPNYPHEDYLNQLILQVRGGQFSGAAQMDVAWLSTLAALGKLRDLAPQVEGRGYTNSGLAAGQIDGAQLGLPWTIAAIGLTTNIELYDAAGANAQPETLEEFEDGLRALKGLGGLIPYAASTTGGELKDIMMWMQTFGCTLIENGKTTIGDDASVDAITWYKKLFDDGLIASDMNRVAARTLFAQAKTAIYDDAPVGKAGVVAQSPDPELGDKMSSAARPVQKAGDIPQELLWGHLVVVVEGDGADTASEFAQWLTSDESETIHWFDKLGLPPTTTKALDSAAVKGNVFVNDFTERVTKDAKASPLWQYVSYSQMEAAVGEQVQAVLIGKSTPKDAMKVAGEAVQKLIG